MQSIKALNATSRFRSISSISMTVAHLSAKGERRQGADAQDLPALLYEKAGAAEWKITDIAPAKATTVAVTPTRSLASGGRWPR